MVISCLKRGSEKSWRLVLAYLQYRFSLCPLWVYWFSALSQFFCSNSISCCVYYKKKIREFLDRVSLWKCNKSSVKSISIVKFRPLRCSYRAFGGALLPTKASTAKRLGAFTFKRARTMDTTAATRCQRNWARYDWTQFSLSSFQCFSIFWICLESFLSIRTQIVRSFYRFEVEIYFWNIGRNYFLLLFTAGTRFNGSRAPDSIFFEMNRYKPFIVCRNYKRRAEKVPRRRVLLVFSCVGR